MRVALFLLLAGAALADTSLPRRDIVETAWRKGDWQFVTNDPFIVEEDAGAVLALQITGNGESCAIRRRLFDLRPPMRVRLRMRWTEQAKGTAHPSAHILLDPPALDHDWWKSPMTGGAWTGEQRVWLFHFATHDHWRQVGMCTNLEAAPGRHKFSIAEDVWTTLQMTLEKDSITIAADGNKIATTTVDLATTRRFAVGFGDQTSTRVELDELQVLPGR